MPPTPPAVEFLHVLAAAALRDGDPDELAARAAGALRGALAERKSLVLDVQFTGFMEKGQLVGGVDPQLLRAAGQLIMLRVSRVGFTRDTGERDLAVLFRAMGKGPGDLGGEGVVGTLRAELPRGIYLSTSTGEVYRPPAAAPREQPAPETPAQSAEAAAPAAPEPPAAPTPAAETEAPAAAPAPAEEEERPASPPAETTAPAPDVAAEEKQPSPPAGAPAAGQGEAGRSFDWDFAAGEDEHELSEFEVIDALPDLDAPPAPAQPRAPAPPPAAAGAGTEPHGTDMYHFFRTSSPAEADAEAEALPGLLRAADNMARFDDLAQAAARQALRLVRSDRHAQAVALLDALVTEAERPDRTRVFRETAVQALRRVGTEQTLQHLAELLRLEGPERERILRFMVFLGGDAIPLLEGVLFRAGDPELRRAIFRRLLAVEGLAGRVMARALADPSPGRARVILELALLPQVDPELALRWITDAAGHADPTVRMDAARHAGTLGGRGGLRVLVDLLSDRERLVQRAAIEGLALVPDPASVPFLARLLNESSDEELQVAAVNTLGRIGSSEGLPVLLALINRRALFSSRRMTRVKTAAVAAIGKIPSPAARDVLVSLAAGKDSDVAPEARRVLDTQG